MKWIVIIVSLLIFNSVAYFSAKRLNKPVIYATVACALLIDVLVDLYASFRYKAWGFFDPDKVEFSAGFIIFGIYPAVTVLIINWYPYRSAKWIKLCYLIGWAVFSTAYEWLTLKVGILWHRHWNLTFSFLLYPFIYYLLIVHVRLYQKLMDRTS